MSKRCDHPHSAHGEPITRTLTDGSTAWDCPCGYAYMNEREALTGRPFRAGSLGDLQWQIDRAFAKESR